MRNISRLDQALKLLNGGGAPRQIQSAIDKAAVGVSDLPRSGSFAREDINKQMLEQRLDAERDLNMVEDPWTGTYETYVPEQDGLDLMREQALMESVALPSTNRKISLDTPVEELTPRELKAQQATRKIIDDKLMMLGLGALASGSTAAVINNSQGDDRDANLILNPVTGTLVGTGLAAGAGGLVGYNLSNAPSREMAVEMSKNRKRGSGNGYQRDAAFERDYGKKYNRQVRQRGIRGGLKGASVAAGGVALLQLLNAINDEGASAIL